jgi:hypothetical protein
MDRSPHRWLGWLKRGWASPWTAAGLLLGALALLSGGAARRRAGVVEFHGGVAAWLLRRWFGGPAALTLGHVILGSDPAILDFARRHEMIHVEQYERWGPLFVPAYLLASLAAWWRGGHSYRDNRFEREAFERSAP